MTLSFTVLGKAEPQGSARAFLPKGWNRPVITSDNPKNKGWRKTVALEAGVAMAEAGLSDLMAGPVELEIWFHLPRPKSLKGREDVPHVTRPDVDKLARSVADALTGVVWKDDSQVFYLKARKMYANPGAEPRAIVVVTEEFPS